MFLTYETDLDRFNEPPSLMCANTQT